MNKKVTQIIDQIKAKYQNIDTILLFGSALSNDWTPDSDIDIFLIDSQYHDSRADLTIDGVQVELQQDNFENIAKDIESERGCLLNRNLATMIATSKTISANSPNKLSALKSLANDVLKSAPIYTDKDVKMWRYSIDDYLAKAAKDVERDDSVAFYFDAHYVIQNALEFSLATHGAYLPQPKRLADLLSRIDPTLLGILNSYTSASTLPDKLSALQKLH